MLHVPIRQPLRCVDVSLCTFFACSIFSASVTRGKNSLVFSTSPPILCSFRVHVLGFRRARLSTRNASTLQSSRQAKKNDYEKKSRENVDNNHTCFLLPPERPGLTTNTPSAPVRAQPPGFALLETRLPSRGTGRHRGSVTRARKRCTRRLPLGRVHAYMHGGKGRRWEAVQERRGMEEVTSYHFISTWLSSDRVQSEMADGYHRMMGKYFQVSFRLDAFVDVLTIFSFLVPNAILSSR